MTAELLALSERMREVAAGQGGVVTTAQCAALGADASAVRALLRAGGWWRAQRGVYRDAAYRPLRVPDRAHHARCAAALARLPGESAAVSHTSAARLLGLPLPSGAPQEVVVTRRPPAPANRLETATHVHVAEFADEDIVDIAGVPVLGGSRIILDCCLALAPASALAVADAALRSGVTTQDALHAAALTWKGRRGARLARRVVDRANPLAENWFESVSRWWLTEAGLPRPALQVRFTDGSGVVRARVDMFIPDHATVGEADGAGKYTDPGALFAEKQREDWLRDTQDLQVVRWVPREMASASGRAAVVDRFHRAFARSACRPPSAL